MRQITICIVLLEFTRGLDPQSTDPEETIQNLEEDVGEILEMIGQGGEIPAAVAESRIIIDGGVIEDIDLSSAGNLGYNFDRQNDRDRQLETKHV